MRRQRRKGPTLGKKGGGKFSGSHLPHEIKKPAEKEASESRKGEKDIVFAIGSEREETGSARGRKGRRQKDLKRGLLEVWDSMGRME